MPLPDKITTAELAALVGVSREQLHGYKDRGIISPCGRNEWNTIEAVTAMMAHYRVSKSRGGTSLDLASERAKLAKEQADGQAMKNAAMRRELLPAGEVNDAVQSAFSRCRARMLSIPSKLSPLLLTCKTIPEIQDSLFDAVSEALAELAATNVVIGGSDRSGSARGSDVVADPAPSSEADGEPVGGREQDVKPRGKRRAWSVGNKAC